MGQCQDGMITAQDIGSYFSQSEEHQALVKKVSGKLTYGLISCRGLILLLTIFILFLENVTARLEKVILQLPLYKTQIQSYICNYVITSVNVPSSHHP